MSSQQQHSLDPTDDLNQILRDFERENAHIFAPPIETPPMPNYDNDFLFNEFLTPNVNAEGNNQYGIGIPSLPQPTPPAPPPSLAVPSPLAAGPPAPPMVAQQIFSNAVNQPPMLVIIEQPIERCRFRYKAEQGPHGALRGVSGKRQKSSPKVKVSFYSIHSFSLDLFQFVSLLSVSFMLLFNTLNLLDARQRGDWVSNVRPRECESRMIATRPIRPRNTIVQKGFIN